MSDGVGVGNGEPNDDAVSLGDTASAVLALSLLLGVSLADAGTPSPRDAKDDGGVVALPLTEDDCVTAILPITDGEGAWAAVAPMLHPRVLAAAAAYNGHLYVAGGEGPDRLNDRHVAKIP